MSPATPGGLRICLIDDDPDHVLIITRAIRELGDESTVPAARDRDLALEWLRSSDPLPDLIPLDINMPWLSGFDVLVAVKADVRLKAVPIVMLTSSDASADVARAYELGASGYISKPSYFHDLRAVLGNTLLYWSAMRRASVQNEGGSP